MGYYTKKIIIEIGGNNGEDTMKYAEACDFSVQYIFFMIIGHFTSYF